MNEFCRTLFICFGLRVLWNIYMFNFELMSTLLRIIYTEMTRSSYLDSETIVCCFFQDIPVGLQEDLPYVNILFKS